MSDPQSKARGLRWSTLAEVLALGAGCVVLFYYTCRDDSERPSAERSARVFSAPRDPGAAASSDAERSRREIELWFTGILTGVATGEVQEQQRAEIQRHLLQVLEQRGSGRPETRANAAGMIVQQLFDRAKLANVTPELSGRQREAIQAMAREMTRQLLLLAVGASPGADALPVTLPEGYTKLDWKHMGGFRYVEGGPLPADISALDGSNVGVAGFILTLGETERMHEFILLESLWGCCFGAVPELNQTIVVRLAPDHAFDYTAAPVLITGKLEVGEEKQGGFVASLYRIVDASATPLQAPRQ
ncbi:MAG TPA: DUF3299 domain-containing protein [Polyangiaceae bacterium]|nr:DUF3299 domain-containing protein [Polyangiaceae bacterium]